MSSITSFYRLYEVMSFNDFITLLTSLSISLAIGGTILYFVFTKMLAQPPQQYLHQNQQQKNVRDKTNNNNNKSNNNDDTSSGRYLQQKPSTGGTLPMSVTEDVAKKIRETPAHKALLEQQNAAEKFEKKVDHVRRNIPLGASSTLVQKGIRLIEEGAYDEALVCFLALLYSAVEGGKAQPDNLPAHLAECLRGAGTCYRKMGQIEIAARFFQAERLIYEEMVASLGSDYQSSSSSKKGEGDAGGKNAVDKSRAIVASLFRDDEKDDPEKSVPRRCRILQEVAKQCMKHGHVQVALSYQLKNAAVKRKVSGKAMEPNSEEFHQIAEMLRQLSPDEVKAAQQAAQSEETRKPTTTTTSAAKSANNQKKNKSENDDDDE